MTSSTTILDAVDPPERKSGRSSLWAISLFFAMITILFNLTAIVVFMERHKVFAEREMSVSTAESQTRADRADLEARLAAHRNLQSDFAKTQEDLGKNTALLTDLNRQLAGKEAELTTLQDARQQLQAVSQEAANAKSELQTASAAKEQAEDEMNGLKALLSSSTIERDRLLAEITKARQDKAATDKELAEAKAKNGPLLADIKSQQDRALAAKKEVETQMAKAQSDLTKARNDLQQTVNDLSKAQSDRRIAEDARDAAREAQVETATKRQRDEDDAAAARERQVAAANDLAKVAAQQQTINADLQRLQPQLITLNSSIEAARSQLAEAENQLTAPRQQLQTARSEIDRLAGMKNDIAKISGELDAAMARQKELMTSIGSLTGQRDNLLTEVTSLTARKATLSEKETQLSEIDETIARQTKTRSDLQAALDALRQGIAAAPPPNTTPLETPSISTDKQGR